MKILFIHRYFPAQFKHLIAMLSKNPNNFLVGVCHESAPGVKDSRRTPIDIRVYKPTRNPTKEIHPYVYTIESSVLNGQAAARIFFKLKNDGFRPDLCFAHIGWGEALYFKDAFADVPLIAYCEFYYHAKGVDADFDPEFPITLDDELRIRTKNAVTLLSLDTCDVGISPTQWQKQLYPKEYQNKISVIHEGIDHSRICPDPNATFTLPNGNMLKKSDEVVTFSVRNLEPYRGFHIFLRAVELVCQRRPNCYILIEGGDSVSYSKRAKGDKSYREQMLDEVKIDPNRVFFLGVNPFSIHIQLFQVSSVHVYLTVPFVLSWSMLEAMSAECLVIGSRTPPVQEVIRHRENGLLVNFFSHREIADLIDEVFTHPNRMQQLRERARQDILDHYDVKKALEGYQQLFRRLVKKTNNII